MMRKNLGLRKLGFVSLVALSLSVFTFSAQAANLVVNGDFSLYTGGSAFQSNSAGTNASQLNDSGTGGYTKLTGWTTGPGSSGLLSFLMNPLTDDTTGSRDIRFNNNFTLWGPGNGSSNGLTASPTGGYYVAMDSAPTYSGSGISQTLTGLTVGHVYTIGFDWAAAQQSGFNGATTEFFKVSFAGSSQSTATFNNANHGFSGWMHQTFSFTANSSSSTLNFLSQGGPDGLPPMSLLDNVTAYDASVPEPLSFLGMGLAAGYGAFYKRKQAKAKQDQKPIGVE